MVDYCRVLKNTRNVSYESLFFCAGGCLCCGRGDFFIRFGSHLLVRWRRFPRRLSWRHLSGGVYVEGMPGSSDNPRLIGPVVTITKDFTCSSNFEMWPTNDSKVCTVYHTAGTCSVAGDFSLGTQNDNIGTDLTANYYLSGGTIRMTGSGKALTISRKAVNSYGEVSGTGVIDLGSGNTLCVNPSWTTVAKSAEFRLKTGGTLIGKAQVDIPSGKVGKFVYDGGTHRAASADLLVTGHSANGYYVDQGGVVFDTAGFECTAGYKLQKVDDNSGALVKIGAGVLTLTAANTYCGGTIISNGTLVANSAASLPGYAESGKVRVCSGATLTLGTGWTDAQKADLRRAIVVEEGGNFGDPQAFATPTADVTDANSYANPDGAIKTGAYGLTLSGHNDFGGKFTVKEGTLQAAFGQGLNANDCVVLSGGTYAGWNGRADVTLGTAGSQVYITPASTSGFSALAGDTTVTAGAEPLVFGSALFNPGAFLLNDVSAKGRLFFATPINLDNKDLTLTSASATANPGVLAGGLWNVDANGEIVRGNSTVLKSGNGHLCLAGTNVFKKLSHEYGCLTLSPGSTNEFTEMILSEFEGSPVVTPVTTVDGARVVADRLSLGYTWNTRNGKLTFTNDQHTTAKTLQLQQGYCYQYGGMIETDSLTLGASTLGTSSHWCDFHLAGGVVKAKTFYMGPGGSGIDTSTDKLFIEGGEIQCGFGTTDVELGKSTAATSYCYVRDGKLVMADAGSDGKTKSLAVGMSGRATLEVSNMGLVDVPFVYFCGWSKNNKTAYGELQLLTGGTVRTGVLKCYAAGCNATFLMDGGTLLLRKPTSSDGVSQDFFSNVSNVWVGANGGVIDTTNLSSKAVQPMLAKPGVTAPAYDPATWATVPALAKRGTGSFTLAGANAYPCATAVEAGTLKLASGASLPADSIVRIAEGATLDLGGNATTVKLLGGAGAVTGDIAVSDDFAVAAESLAAKKAMAVAGKVTFGEGAVVDVRGVDCETFARTTVFLSATDGIEGDPQLRVNGVLQTGDTWRLVKSNGQLKLSPGRGFVLLFR